MKVQYKEIVLSRTSMFDHRGLVPPMEVALIFIIKHGMNSTLERFYYYIALSREGAND
ncbi:hypothetical protein [Candidatus Erwinia haradaeae]|uniref:hypothetical protein n=1 Tax=Candidatus Erwinia haradaeae TaxID=1922217 RepID=UPI0013003D7F|nr:hypothetical protein [Candidatus Erwinia haradaeae]